MSERNDMPGAAPTPARKRRGLGLLLTLSLGVNLLVAGAIGTMVWMHDGHGRGGKSHGSFGGPLTRALAPEDKRALGGRRGRPMGRAAKSGWPPMMRSSRHCGRSPLTPRR